MNGNVSVWFSRTNGYPTLPQAKCSDKNALQVLPHHCQLCAHRLPCGPGELHVPNVGISLCLLPSGYILDMSQGLLERTDSYFVVSSSLPSISSLAIISLMTGNSSFLFSPFYESHFSSHASEYMCTAIPNFGSWATPTSLVYKCFEAVTGITVPDGIYT